MRILHVVPSYWPAVRYGGPIVSVMGLCEALAKHGHVVDVLTTNADGPSDVNVEANAWTEINGVNVMYCRRMPRVDYAFSPALFRALRARVSSYDVVHLTSLFSFPTLAGGAAARRHNIPYVVSPRGSLMPQAMKRARWKKWPHWLVADRRTVGRADSVHATSAEEAKAIRMLLPFSRIAVVPNALSPVHSDAAKIPFRIVTMGRIHPIKGLDILVAAASLVAKRFPGTELLIAGDGAREEKKRIERIIDTLSPRPKVTWLGDVRGKEKYDLLASAVAAAFPSHSENFGQAILEALACGTSVVASQNCPWQLLETSGAGYWVPNTPEAFAAQLMTLLGDLQLSRTMGLRGRELAGMYLPDAIAKAMTTEYQYIASVKSGSAGSQSSR